MVFIIRFVNKPKLKSKIKPMKLLKRLAIPALLALLSMTFLMTSCSKDDDDDDSKTATELLTANTWNATKFEMSMAGMTMDMMQEPGAKFNITFKTDGTYSVVESIFGEEESTDSGTWEFIEDETAILFDKGTEDEMELTVNSLSSSMVKVSGTMTEDGMTGTMTIELVPL